MPRLSDYVTVAWEDGRWNVYLGPHQEEVVWGMARREILSQITLNPRTNTLTVRSGSGLARRKVRIRGGAL